MQFTAADVIQSMYDRPARRRDRTLDAWLVARQFNRILQRTVRRVHTADPERLATEIVVPNTDVQDNNETIDLTSSDTREWLFIYAIDWRASSTGEYSDEVVLGTIEARHRLDTEFGTYNNPIGYLVDGMNTIRKVSGWSGVYDIRVYGTVVPEKVNPSDGTGFKRVYDYPQPLRDTLETELTLSLSVHLKLTEWALAKVQQEHEENVAAMLDDAETFVDPAARVDDVAHHPFYG